MNANRRLHRRFLEKRQGLGGVVGGLLGGADTPTSSNVASQDPGLGGAIGGITSIVNLPTTLPPSPSATSSSTPSTRLSSSSTGSTTTSTTSSTSTSSTTSTSTSSPSRTPTPTLTPTSSASDIVYSTTSGDTIVYITSTVPAPSTSVTPAKSFLQNPPLEGGVFTAIGIAALIIIFVLVTWTIRKRHRNRLDRDAATAAITFDPAMTDHYDDARGNSIEKHRLSGSSSGHGHGFGYGAQPAYAPQLAPPQGYYGHAGYGRYPAAAYRPPSPNPAPYRSPSPAAYGDNLGGANLTRKYSDRKPVPPLLPDPVYDPSHTQASAPQQYYQEQPLPPAPQVQGGNIMATR
ncbi:hypothetical protein PAXRUDRAFT_265188 [Paxillus rubicundulus Ve08.2h10]|uniref:Transmembrane protein n=1 Tax=Paxillus rubicundulus Ve08.2h10 TaxID=930991 RepID=A0A0D0DGD8_9AGAM|nr:hypothetical protein PAXRUDRAFT_265188 [Paxillus rubicundulus Ve08.2h10]